MNRIVNRRLSKIDVLDYDCTDIGAGDMFVDVYEGYVKYISSTKEYRIWNEELGIWKADTGEQINELAKELVSDPLHASIASITNEGRREQYARWVKNLQSNAGIGNMLKSARSRPAIAASVEDFDKNPRFINLENGVLDLRGGVSKKHNPKYMFTKCAGVRYDPDVEDETWMRFLLSIMKGDAEMVNYLLRTIAYALTGDPKYDVMFLLYGPTTRNGKTTFANGIANFFGEYAIDVPAMTLAKQNNKSSSAPTPDIARLKGFRYMNVAEIPNNLQLDVAKIKKFVGGDKITGRLLHKGHITFTLQGVFFLHANHFPNVDDSTLFSSRRIIIIPFNVHLSENEIDFDMEKKLTREKAKSALLNMLIKVMQDSSLNPKDDMPKEVIEATRQFIQDADSMQYFIDKAIRNEPGGWVPTAEIAALYNKWAVQKGYPIASTKAITAELKKRGFHNRRKNSGVGFADIRLRYPKRKSN